MKLQAKDAYRMVESEDFELEWKTISKRISTENHQNFISSSFFFIYFSQRLFIVRNHIHNSCKTCQFWIRDNLGRVWQLKALWLNCSDTLLASSALCKIANACASLYQTVQLLQLLLSKITPWPAIHFNIFCYFKMLGAHLTPKNVRGPFEQLRLMELVSK